MYPAGRTTVKYQTIPIWYEDGWMAAAQAGNTLFAAAPR
jgi:hypothetical protein